MRNNDPNVFPIFLNYFIFRNFSFTQKHVGQEFPKTLYDGLMKQRLDEFMAGFNLVSLKLKMYQVS